MPDAENLAPGFPAVPVTTVVAALDQDVRHHFGQRSPGNREQMTLALGSRVLHQCRIVQPHRLRQDRRGDFYCVVERQ